mmetsp:Transcript_16276/g.23869  ORF Transcript_16276/g.23869 Transcript_16276/m.23869 type:complete len:92 (+) Transcript_16276:2550-2825(+)
MLSDSHGKVNHEKEICVKRTNVVQDVCGALTEAEEDDEEIKTPEHLQDAHQAVVTLEIEEGKVTKSSHPHITCNHNTDGVVSFFSMVVVIK